MAYEFKKKNQKKGVGSSFDDAAMGQRVKQEQERYKLATDSHFWICVVFDSREDAEGYLDDMNLRKHGDKYIDASAWLKELA